MIRDSGLIFWATLYIQHSKQSVTLTRWNMDFDHKRCLGISSPCR